MSITLSDSAPALGVLWGKSNAGGVPHLLLAHLLDTAAVAELLWDRYLAPSLKVRVDACCVGRGREFFALLCGLHDVGKATPAFQAKVPDLAVAVREAGLTWPRDASRAAFQKWHHTGAGAYTLRRVLRTAGWSRRSIGWVVPLVAGHHGVIPGAGRWSDPPGRGHAQGMGSWVQVQDAAVASVAAVLGVDLAATEPRHAPSRATQLALSGAMVMADWIASDDQQFSGVSDLARVSMVSARERAGAAWERLGLSGGFDPARLGGGPDLVRRRFGVDARPVQADAVALAEGLPGPGLLLVEAPMGEGKTEAALAAVEVLARRFGADGVFVGMPTQATSDPMFTRVHDWLARVDPDVPLALLHGKRRFNPEWQKLLAGARFTGVADDGRDEFGVDDVYGVAGGAAGADREPGDVPAEWFLGRKRGLLVPVTVGTIDHLLHAATRTRHVMLRHAGLSGRVVVLDEVHAYDVYMEQFLSEALRWLGDGGVPVVLLSATLPPRMRRALVRAYLEGATRRTEVDLEPMPVPQGYPTVLSACSVDGGPAFDRRAAAPWRESLPVAVQVVPEGPGDGAGPVVALVADAVWDGGCALVVRNTVARAQQVYQELRAELGPDVVLLHARLTAQERADRTERVLDRLGRPGRDGGADRPERLVVVATQVAEQSFDVDADLLVTDLAPIDLLLQRAGRLHRHDRPEADRPHRLRRPTVVVTGMGAPSDLPPWLPPGSRAVYGEHLLLRAAALVAEAARTGGWSVPADVPALVARGYGDSPLVPPGWADAAASAGEKWDESQRMRAGRAASFLLSPPTDLGKRDLDGLHENATAELDDEDQVAAVVRDGEPSAEVVLVRRDTPDGGYRSLGGRSLGPTGEAVSDEDVMPDVVGATIRLPARKTITEAALAELRPLPGWAGDPWLRTARALVLDADLTARLGGYRFRYDPELGLVHERAAT